MQHEGGGAAVGQRTRLTKLSLLVRISTVRNLTRTGVNDKTASVGERLPFRLQKWVVKKIDFIDFVIYFVSNYSLIMK